MTMMRSRARVCARNDAIASPSEACSLWAGSTATRRRAIRGRATDARSRSSTTAEPAGAASACCPIRANVMAGDPSGARRGVETAGVSARAGVHAHQLYGSSGSRGGPNAGTPTVMRVVVERQPGERTPLSRNRANGTSHLRCADQCRIARGNRENGRMKLPVMPPVAPMLAKSVPDHPARRVLRAEVGRLPVAHLPRRRRGRVRQPQREADDPLLPGAGRGGQGRAARAVRRSTARSSSPPTTGWTSRRCSSASTRPCRG